MARLRLLVALDALLVEGGVTRAAARLGIGTSATSRLLAQLRDLYGDRLFVRTARGLQATPLAESLRTRLRALAAEAQALAAPAPPQGASQQDPAWRSAPIIEAAPLSLRSEAEVLEGEPQPAQLARRLSALSSETDPKRRLARYIALVAAGVGRSRPLTEAESEDAFRIMLEGRADASQVGALLGVMHYRGETATELAGIVRASSTDPGFAPDLETDLQWPAYISPRSHRVPWFLQAARLVAQSGLKVLLHGSDGLGEASGMLVTGARALGIPVCTDAAAAQASLSASGIAYLPLAAFAPGAQRLLSLHALFEARNPMNAAAPLISHFRFRSIVLGVSRPQEHRIQLEAARILGVRSLSMLGGSRDVAQATPFRPSAIYRFFDGHKETLNLPQTTGHAAYPIVGFTTFEHWRNVWTGAARDPRAESLVLSTTAIALLTARMQGFSYYENAFDDARRLWNSRPA